jgi:GNAT superfamily N-acetyltransferase
VTNLRIRAVEAGDLIPDDLPAPRPDVDGARWRRTRVAVADGQIVGIASVALSAATDSYFCEVEVVPGHRRRGIGTQLYAAVHRLTDPRFPVLARAMDSFPLRRRFAEALGCSVVTRCPAPWIDPPTPAAESWATGQQAPAGYRTTVIGDRPLAIVKDAWASSFAWVHRAFGAVHIDRIPQMWDQYSKGVDPAASAVAVDRNQTIVAFSLVSPDAWDGRTFIVAETAHPDQAHGTQVLGATVATSVTVLARRGTRRVQLEGHTTDRHTPDVMRSLPAVGSDPMDILRLEPPPAVSRGGCR